MASKSEFTKIVALSRSRGWAALCLTVWFLALSLSANAQQGTFVTFDVPGAGTGFFEGTFPFAINPAGAVTGGYYTTNNFGSHGFLRAHDGTITSFDPPESVITQPLGINPAGAITGISCDAVFCHGFLRAPDGTFTIFDAPGADATFATSINPQGAITGSYADANCVSHGLLRDPDGTITTFDAPGAATGCFGTQTSMINPAGTIVGTNVDAHFVFHGFIRAPDGTFTTFDAPGAGAEFYASQGTCGPTRGSIVSCSINAAGVVAGCYVDANNVSHGFLRTRDGTFTTFDAPGALNTNSAIINPAGVIAGSYSDFNGVSYGYVREPDGTFITLDAPGAGTGPFQGTFAGAMTTGAINPAGRVTGWYLDANNVDHGFLWTPHGNK